MAIGRRPLLLLLHGNIHTMNPEQPLATAMAVDRSSGRILAVGDDADVLALAGPLTETASLRGRTLLPGFIDAHTHLVGYAQARLDVDLRGAKSEEEAAGRVRLRAGATPAGRWIIGHGWDKNAWQHAAFPTKGSLDAVTPEHPVALWDHAYHALWVNSEALRRAGIDAQTPEPEAGSIGRGADGEPAGMLFEFGATDLVERVIEPTDDEALLGELRTVLGELRARGVTGVHNIEGDQSLRLFQRLRNEGTLATRVLLYIPRQWLPNALALGLQADFGDDLLRFGGVKLFMDGALGPQTAAMLDPYEGQAGNRGLLTLDDAETQRLVTEAAHGGLGVAIHAIGDRAVKTALDGIEASLRSAASGDERTMAARRLRLEHVQLARAEDVARMARLGVVASVQPFHAVADRDTAERHWGARYQRAYAYQTLRESGVRLALGSDIPVDTCDPLRILHAAVARKDDATPDRPAWTPQQALTLAQALWGYTVGAAYAGGQEARQGSIEPGKLADLVVLEEDPFTVPAERIVGAEIAATIVGGEIVHGGLE
jgi:predicted amidohydrolase YtcJ